MVLNSSKCDENVSCKVDKCRVNIVSTKSVGSEGLVEDEDLMLDNYFIDLSAFSISEDNGTVSPAVGVRKARMVQKIVETGVNITKKMVVDLVNRVFNSVDEVINMESAIKDFGHCVIDSEDVNKCENALNEANGSLELLVQRLQQSRYNERLSPERVYMLSNDNPHKLLLSEIAAGFKVVKSDEISKNNRVPKFRSKAAAVKGACNFLATDLVKKGNAIILSKKVVEKHKLVLHYGATHWTLKSGKSVGRILLDLGVKEHGLPLNSKDSRCLCRQYYGPIILPTLNDIVLMILRMEIKFNNNTLVLWKMDLKGAFTLLDISAGDCSWFAGELANDLILIYITGLFGWTGTPFVFNVLSRALYHEAMKITLGELVIYVDDLIGCCLASEVDREKANMANLIESICGPGSVAQDKTESGRVIDGIGYNFDLDARAVGLSDSNYLKTVYGLFSINLDHVSVLELQRVASWMSRYGNIVTWLKPFSKEVYRSFRGLSNPNCIIDLGHAKIRISEIIELWIKHLTLVELDVHSFGRSFDSFTLYLPDLIVEFDASLEGFGIALLDVNTNKLCYGFSFFIKNLYNLNGQSKHQNSMEFIAVVVGLFWISLLNLGKKHFTIRGDSIVALCWARKEIFRSGFCANAVLCFSQLLHIHKYTIVDAVHIKGSDNGLCDSFSRGIPVNHGLDDQHFFSLRNNNISSKVIDLINFCNPSVKDVVTSVEDDIIYVSSLLGCV